MWHFCFKTLTETASLALATDLAPLLGKGDVLALDGDLGLGKSTLARALLRTRGQDPYLEVPSPTFTLVQTYEFEDLAICHFDLYRIGDFEELYEIGLEEAWHYGAALIEWPDRAEDLLPAEALWLQFEAAETSGARKLTLSGPAQWGNRLQRICEKRALLIKAGWQDGVRNAIPGDLSPRSYERISRMALPDLEPDLENEAQTAHSIDLPEHAILIDSPAHKPGPELADGRLYDEVAHRVTSLTPMIAVTEGLKALGLRVPNIYGHDTAAGLMVWEDFGTENLAIDSETPIADRYHATVRALASLHGKPIPSAFSCLEGSHDLPSYDEAAFAVELDVFLDWYWPHIQGTPCPEATRAEFSRLWHPLLTEAINNEQSLVLRDCQSPNCFYLGNSPRPTEPAADIGFIDFQDCLIGPVAYDLAALCLDARITISPTLELALLDTYFVAKALDKTAQEAFLLSYAICAVQRISKNLGAFARASASLGREDYLAHMPRSLDYLRRSLAHPALSELRTFYAMHGLLDGEAPRTANETERPSE